MTAKIFKLLKQIPWYVFLLSIYPVVALYAHNVTETDVANLWRPLLISLGAAVLFLLLFRLILKDWYRAALVTVILIVMFFAYGHVYIGLKSFPLGLLLARHRILLPVWVVLAGLGVWLAGRRSSKAAKWTNALNVVAVVALAFPLVQIGMYFVHSQNAQVEETVPYPELSLPSGQTPPDVYYIVLDAYGRHDVLLDVMDYDNSAFLDALRAQGFYIADCSQSNYAQTQTSLDASLNMNYLPEISSEFLPGGNGVDYTAAYLKWSSVRRSFEYLGYKIVAYETGFYWSHWSDADVFLSPSRTLWSGWNEFEDLLVKTSSLRAVYDLNAKLAPKTESTAHRDRILYTLDSLKVMPSLPGPKFVFVHMIIPHEPFDIGPNGEYVESWSRNWFEAYVEGYQRQVAFISNALPEVTEAIIANSATPPVIIVQGDHGPAYFFSAPDHMKILNAYYLPQGSDALYDTISPVNTFRVIFDTYFNGDFPLLPDISYAPVADDMFDVYEIPNPCLEK